MAARLFPALPHLPGSRLKQFVRLLFAMRSYAKEIGKCIGRYPLRDVFFGLRHGFAADRIFLYGRQGILSGDYLTDLQRQFSRFINPKPVRELLEDKLLFGALAGHITEVPETYLYTNNGRIVVVSADWLAIARCRDPAKIYRLVEKRARGGGGVGIRFLEISQGIVRTAGEEVELDDFLRSFACRDEVLLCQFIEQSSFCRKIYPATANTLRVICMRERGGEPFIAKVILRLGTQKSRGVDNFGRGGLAVIVDPETGQLGEAVEHNAVAPCSPTIHHRHPDTGTQIAGELLPGWRAAQEEALRLMRHLPFINYVGWDIILADTGPVVLEGNNYTGVRLAQIQSGLLSDPRIRAFYQNFGIVCVQDGTSPILDCEVAK